MSSLEAVVDHNPKRENEMARMRATVGITVEVEFDDDEDTDLKSQAIDAMSEVFGLGWAASDAVVGIDVIGEVEPMPPPSKAAA